MSSQSRDPARRPVPAEPAGRTRTSWYHNPQLSYGVRFIALAAPLSLFYAYPREDGAIHDLIRSYLAAYASVAGHVIALFDPTVRVSGSQILGAYSLEIV